MHNEMGLFIDGQWRTSTASGGEYVLNPADESELGWLPHAGDADLQAAVDAARRGFGIWRKTPAKARGDVLKKAAALITDERDVLAKIITLEQGKPLAESLGEVDRAVETFQWNGEQAKNVGETLVAERGAGVQQTMLPQPLGISLGLTAWNFPIILPARKLGPALAAGCSMILKASEETPGTAVALVKILERAGLPAGVVNLVFGVPAHISKFLFPKEEIRKISFTGSVPVGKLLAGLAAPTLKRCTFELGGHSPAIVCEDADLPTALDTLAGFKFRNAGQVCIAPSRFYVHKKHFDAMVDGFVERAERQKLGNGLDDGVTMGPMANARRVTAMEDFIRDATNKGARVLTGGKRYGNAGFFFEPTVMVDVANDAKILNVEPFGPVAPLMPFTDLDEVIEKSNTLAYGLASYAFTQSAKTADRLADELEAGGVAINTAAPMQADAPFGGVKDSGIGYEGGIEGIESFLHKKSVSRANV
ncbi:MAG: NAD-dependent succinate-semialdehyde dehydrogenase [Gammaproteobacteria bacterium]